MIYSSFPHYSLPSDIRKWVSVKAYRDEECDKHSYSVFLLLVILFSEGTQVHEANEIVFPNIFRSHFKLPEVVQHLFSTAWQIRLF